MPKKIYTEEMIDWLKQNVPGHYIEEILPVFYKKFNKQVSYKNFRCTLSRYKIRTGMLRKIPLSSRIKHMILTPEELEIFKQNNWHKTVKEMVVFCKNTFNKDLTERQIKQIRQRNHFISGFTGRFEKGSIPPNKGKKGYYAPGSEKGWFKKGNITHNTAPLNTEYETDDGYIKIKIAMPNKWQYKHRIIWEKQNGPIPAGHMVIFLDGNKKNFDIKNLKLISQKECATLNKMHLRTEDPQLTETALAMVQLMHKVKQKQNEISK